MASLAGHLLVASPHLLDPNFVKSVVLLVQHTEQGALGVVVNRPINKSVQDLWREVGGGPCTNTQPIYLGGPVPGPLMAVHCEELLSEMQIIPGLFFSASKQNLDALVTHPQSNLKIFVGHSGWGAGQLDQELEQGAWLTTPGTLDLIFYNPSEIWQTVSRHIGRSMLQSMLNIKTIPDDPECN
ncbi:MAG TPA: YqgE/AlgH family protein [Thermoguttaceae bacterium]